MGDADYLPPQPGGTPDVDDTPDGPDDVQADPHDDPDADILDGDTDDAQLEGAPAEFANAQPGETRGEPT